MRDGRGEGSCELEQHDPDADEPGITRQGREDGGALSLRGRHGTQDVGDGKGGDQHEEGNDAEDVAPAPLLGDVTGDRGADQGGKHPRQGERCEERGAVPRGGNRAHEHVERDDEEATSQPLQRAPDDEDDDV